MIPNTINNRDTIRIDHGIVKIESIGVLENFENSELMIGHGYYGDDVVPTIQNDGKVKNWCNVTIFGPGSIEGIPFVNACIPTPSLEFPSNNSIIDDSDAFPIIFDWKDISHENPVKYSIQISDNFSFNSLLYEKLDLTESQFTLQLPLADGTYYWQIQATDDSEEISSKFSSPFTFTIDTEILPPKFSPTAILKKTSPLGDIYRGDSISFSAEDSMDPDGNIISYQYDFGDGSKSDCCMLKQVE